MLKTKKSIFILYIILAIAMSGLSCIAFIFNYREIPAAIIPASVFMIGHLAICFYYAAKPQTNGGKELRMYLLIALRSLFVVLAIIVPTLFIGLIPNAATESFGKLRYLFILLSFLPIAVSLICFYIGSNKE